MKITPFIFDLSPAINRISIVLSILQKNTFLERFTHFDIVRQFRSSYSAFSAHYNQETWFAISLCPLNSTF